MKKTYLAFFVVVVFKSLVFACSLPICDLSQRIETLRKVSVAERFEFYTQTLNAFKNSPNKETLENLLQFGQAAYQLAKEIDTEDWMINAAAQIANKASEKLLIARPAQHVALTKYFSGLIGESQATSFSALTFWQSQVQKGMITTKEELIEVGLFAKEAREISKQLGYEEYVLNLTSQIVAQTSALILKIDPYIEGIYRIEGTCGEFDKICLPPTIATILISDEQNGITVSFSRPEAMIADFTFRSVELVDIDSLKSSAQNFATNGHAFSIQFDSSHKGFAGTIQSSRLVSDIKIRGTKIFSTEKLYQKTAPLNPASLTQLQGLFTGKLILKSDPNFPVQFIIRQLDGRLAATLSGENMFLEFTSGHYIAEKGILTFVSTKSSNAIKLVFSVSQDGVGTLKFSGIGITLLTATHWEIELKK